MNDNAIPFIRAVPAIKPRLSDDPRREPRDDRPASRAPQPADGARQNRLVIEPTGDHRFVYKVLDPVTGDVIRQFPREQLLRLREDPGYDPGDVFDTEI